MGEKLGKQAALSPPMQKRNKTSKLVAYIIGTTIGLSAGHAIDKSAAFNGPKESRVSASRMAVKNCRDAVAEALAFYHKVFKSKDPKSTPTKDTGETKTIEGVAYKVSKTEKDGYVLTHPETKEKSFIGPNLESSIFFIKDRIQTTLARRKIKGCGTMKLAQLEKK